MLVFLSIAWADLCVDSVVVRHREIHVDLVSSAQIEDVSIQFDPEACADAPPVLPSFERARAEAGAEPGVATLHRATTLGVEGSGEIESGPLGAERTTVRFTAPSTVPLQIFTDNHANTIKHGGSFVITWPQSYHGAQTVVWSSWNDWPSAGRFMRKPIDSSVPAVEDIGLLGRSLKGAEIAALVARLDDAVRLIHSDTAGWEQGRPTQDILARGEGTPSERGLLLLSMLKGAGYKASPAWFTSIDDPALPRTLPAPHLLPNPAVAVTLGRTTLFLDPGTMGARPPEVPARMRGGRVLIASRNLVVPVDTAAPSGELHINAKVSYSEAGIGKVFATIIPTGAAKQSLRGLLSGLTAERWPTEVRKWITPRGELRDLVVGVKGLDGLSPFSIEIRFTEPVRLNSSGAAFHGPIRDLIAPGLAELLPPGVAIAERIHVSPPPGMFVLTAVRQPAQSAPEVLVNRSLSTKERGLTLSSDWHVLSPKNTSAVVTRLTEENHLLIFPTDGRKSKRALKQFELPDDESAIVLSMLYWRLQLDKKAGRVLKKLRKRLSIEQIAHQMVHYIPPGDRRPWAALSQLVTSDAERIAVLEGLATVGERRLAWQLATALTQSDEVDTQVRALIEVAHLQGPQPDEGTDREAYYAWRDPIKLLELAKRRAKGKHTADIPLARAYLRGGRAMDAVALLDVSNKSPLAKAVYAEFGGRTGAYGVDVLTLVDAAISEEPFNPAVRDATGRALAAIGRRRQGVANVLLAAELTGNDSALWLDAAEVAAENGDLRAAIFAARRASDLSPKQLMPAVRLQLFAKLAGDDQTLAIAIERSQHNDLYFDREDDLSALIKLAPEYELAVLRFRAAEVESSRTLLRRRAALHYSKGMIEDAALDGSLLIDVHRDSTGARYLVAGITSQFRHSDPVSLLSRHLRDPSAKEARMDIQLVLGTRLRTTGARAKILRELRRHPDRVARDAPTWPVGMKDFEYDAPPTFQPNKLFSGPTGVLAWSNPEAQATILRTERSTGDLPPPIANLYQAGPTVLSTSRGATVIRLEGGAIPIYAGITLQNGQDVIGLGLSPTGARDALLWGIGELSPPTDLELSE